MIPFLLARLIATLGSYQNGEIEIVTDPIKVSQIEDTQENRLLNKGFSQEDAYHWSRTGVVAEDIYWKWERDAVIFPSGAVGTYNRLSWKTSAGVAILPIMPDGRIALNLNFRHATRSWEWELPRGGPLKAEGSRDAAKRELQEETGLSVKKLVSLGSMAPDTGVLSSVVDIYAGWVGSSNEANPEFSEAIDGIYTFSIEELERGLQKGYIEVDSKGKVPIRDPFLTFALFQVKSMIQIEEKPKVGVGVIVLSEGRVLMGKRKGSHSAGTWAFPGGHLEFGESVEECAKRELLEETGLQAKNVRRSLWTNDVMDGKKHYVTLFMIVDEFEGKLETREPSKCEGWQWHIWEDLPEPLFSSISSLRKENPQPF